MHLKNQPPIFIPQEYWDEIEKLSKAALMDLAWDYASSTAASEANGEIMTELRKRIEIVVLHRKQAKVPA